jgi:DNA-binding FadR family transcriptional regulator
VSEAVHADASPAPNAASVVAAQIRKQIVMGGLAEGAVLPPEAEMVKRLGVSRPTLRQALRILETEHLITVQRGSRGGTTVRGPSARLASRYLSDLLRYRNVGLGDVLKAQLMIEPVAVALLARRHHDASVAALRELVAEAPPTGVDDGAAGFADHFHERLVELAGNATLAQYAKLVHYLIRGQLRRIEPPRRDETDTDRRDPADAHSRLVDLIEAGAVHAASNHWHWHLQEIRDQLGQRLDLEAQLELQQ